jgi:hypothetical protein
LVCCLGNPVPGVYTVQAGRFGFQAHATFMVQKTNISKNQTNLRKVYVEAVTGTNYVNPHGMRGSGGTIFFELITAQGLDPACRGGIPL